MSPLEVRVYLLGDFVVSKFRVVVDIGDWKFQLLPVQKTLGALAGGGIRPCRVLLWLWARNRRGLPSQRSVRRSQVSLLDLFNILLVFMQSSQIRFDRMGRERGVREVHTS